SRTELWAAGGSSGRVITGSDVQVPSHTVSQRHRDDPLEVGEVEWLVDIGERAELKGLTSERGVCIPGDDDHSGRWIGRTDSFEQCDAVRPGKGEVEQNQLGSRENGELQTRVARQCTEDTVALFLETPAEDVDHIRVVVDHKNPAGGRRQRHGVRPLIIRDASTSVCFRFRRHRSRQARSEWANSALTRNSSARNESSSFFNPSISSQASLSTIAP